MLSVYQAEPADFHFIYPELIRTARKKHFLLDTRDQDKRDYLKHELKRVLKEGFLENGLQGQPLLFQDQDTPVGFTLLSEIIPGQGGNEIYLFMVHHTQQGKGYGSAMLDEINRRWQKVDLYARCLPASQTMHAMLLRRGFQFTYTNADGASVLLRKKIEL